MSIWTVLVYLLVLLTLLLAVVGALEVLRRVRAQERLRQELIRLQVDQQPGAPPNPPADDGEAF